MSVVIYLNIVTYFFLASETPPGFLESLSSHLLLVYTGKTRLARNLLQVRSLLSARGLLIRAVDTKN